MVMQRVCEMSLTGTSDKINALLEEGYEVTDIIPVHETSGGAMFSRARGNYVLKVLVLLSPSDRRTTMEYKLVTRRNGYMTSLNQLMEDQNSLGFKARYILPLNVHLDPEARAGIGKGTYGFGVFFFKDQDGGSEDLNESDPVD